MTKIKNIFDKNFEKKFPANLDDCFQIEYSDYESMASFLINNENKIFDLSKSETQIKDSLLSKERISFYKNSCDIFSISNKTQTIGYQVLQVLDWETVYWRYVNILPEFRGNQLFEKIFTYIFSCLSNSKVTKMVADISSGHHKQVHRMIDLGFEITGQSIDDTLGVTSKVTFFCNQEKANKFSETFFRMPRLTSTARNLKHRRAA